MPKTMYDIIKKQNGERFARAIRDCDNGIFDVPNIDKIVKYAGRDAEPILQYLASLKNIKIVETGNPQNPFDLLDKAGYNAYVADTLGKQNAIRQYFAPGEELCTFRDANRYLNYYIVNAVRKDVDNIKRKDFKNPQREDEYGTSVLSIQILKKGGFISIKNRYNHKVDNCDNTYNSNPDNIIVGLAEALKHYFNVNFSTRTVLLPDGYVLISGQVCKYNSEINNTYFGDDFYICGGNIVDLNRDYQLMLGRGYVYDNSKKSITDTSGENKVLFDTDFFQNKKVRIIKNKDNTVSLFADSERVLSVENGEMFWVKPKSSTLVDLTKFKLRGHLDFSGAKNLGLFGIDLRGAKSLRFSEKTDSINLNNAKLPECDLDFSGISRLDMYHVDFSGMKRKSVKFPKNAKEVNLGWAKLHECDLEFNNVDTVVLASANLSNVRKINFANVGRLVMWNTIMPQNCDLDFANITEKLSLGQVNLLGARNIKMPVRINGVDLVGAKLPACRVDLSGAKKLELGNADLSRVTDLKLPIWYLVKNNKLKLMNKYRAHKMQNMDYMRHQNLLKSR